MTTPTTEQSIPSSTTLRCEHVESPTLSAELLRARLRNADRAALAERIRIAAGD